MKKEGIYLTCKRCKERFIPFTDNNENYCIFCDRRYEAWIRKHPELFEHIKNLSLAYVGVALIGSLMWFGKEHLLSIPADIVFIGYIGFFCYSGMKYHKSKHLNSIHSCIQYENK